jgi:hypothetical protein
MNAYRFACRSVLGLSRWLTIAFTVFGLSACDAIGTSFSQTVTAQLPTAVTTAPAAPTATSTVTLTSTTANAWRTYRNDRVGYTVEYPATWKVNERTDSDGAEVTTFSPDPNNDGMSVTVIVRGGEPAGGEIPDMPNTRCQQVTIGRLSGRRCFDTLAFSTSTTLLSQGKQYTIAGSGKHLDQNVYQHFLDSFTVTT